MRLIDEYLCRRAECHLKTPCGVCLYRSDTGSSIVMTVTNVYGKREKLNVRFFDIETTEKEPVLVEEKIVDRNKIFDFEIMGGDKFQVMEFVGAEFPESPPSGNDIELVLIENFYNNLYNGELHRDERTIFLRMAYYSGHTPREKGKKNSQDERTIALWQSKLHFDTPMLIAPEILFSSTFPIKEKPTNKLAQLIKNMEAMTFDLNVFITPGVISPFQSMGFGHFG